MTIQLRNGLPGQGMTFSQRRRFIHLLRDLVANSVIPFFIGAVFALLVTSYSMLDLLTSIDKTGFAICSNIKIGQGVNQ